MQTPLAFIIKNMIGSFCFISQTKGEYDEKSSRYVDVSRCFIV